MFQSSSTASGILPRQLSSACSPSSASAISNSSPSRMRRATFRMTLESSTTRQVFITTSLSFQLTVRNNQRFFTRPYSCRLSARSDIENTVDIKDDQKLVFEPMHSSRHAGEPGIEVDGFVFATGSRKLQYFTDFVDQQAIGLALTFDSDCEARAVARRLRQPEASTHVDGGDDTAAQVEQACNFRRRKRHPREARGHEYVL